MAESFSTTSVKGRIKKAKSYYDVHTDGVNRRGNTCMLNFGRSRLLLS